MNRNPGLSGRKMRMMADDILGIVHRMRNTLQLVTSMLPRWNSKLRGMTIHAIIDAYSLPTVQKADNTMMKGLRYFLEKNSAK